MLSQAHQATLKFSIISLLALMFVSFSASKTMAQDLSVDKIPGSNPQTNSVNPAERANDHPQQMARTIPIVVKELPTIARISDDNSSQAQASKSTSSNSSSSAFTPLTPGQKFKYFARSSFMPPTPYGLSVLSGVFSEATDNDHHRHMTTGDFLADSMTHAARSMAFRATANFFEKFAFATAFKQDPQYHRSDKKGVARIGYALSRVFITYSDSGHNQFNTSFFAGGLTAAGISNAWAREEDRTVSSTLSRFGFHVAYRGLSNVVRELFGKR